MPGFDRTGPMGFGPRTGRGLGYCGGYAPGRGAGYGRGFGRGYGRGYGRGLGWGYGRGLGWRGAVPWAPGWIPAVPYSNERDWLKAEAKAMEQDLDAIRRRLDELSEDDKD